jgi:hypothetical protein
LRRRIDSQKFGEYANDRKRLTELTLFGVHSTARAPAHSIALI